MVGKLKNFPGNALALDRRGFLKAASAAAGATAITIGTSSETRADGDYPGVLQLRRSMGAERIARITPLGYLSRVASNQTTKWVQIDLGQTHTIDQIKLMPLLGYSPVAEYFPSRFRLEVSADETCTAPHMISDQTQRDFPQPGNKVVTLPAHHSAGRFVRLTATKLNSGQFGMSKIEVWSGGRDVAEGCRVTDSDGLIEFDAASGGYIAPQPLAHGGGSDQANYEALRLVYPCMPPYTANWSRMGVVMPLTRRPRPQGEGVITDNAGNVMPVANWRPVKFKAIAPQSGVTIGGGLFQTVMENNIAYLLGRFGVAELLRPFRQRAGKPNPPNLPPPVPFWDTDLPGSNAGRFMMGAGNTLRWMEHKELRQRLDAVVAGIAECQRPDGYAMAYPEDSIFYSERAAYTRSWVTHGLVDAGLAGQKEAFGVLRRFYDWFDRCDYLPELLRRASQGVQGMIANTRTYFTPVGKPKDLQVIQRYFQENYWLEGLARRDPRAVWLYPYDHPHCYLLTSITPYLDLYRATGAAKYLEAVLGAWDLYLWNWQHTGGAISICEGYAYPPRSAFLHLQNGENCGSSFWVSLNHGLLQLFPDREQYAGEIEKSIYNVLIANQAGTSGIRYHASLDGQKENGTQNNSCCEGQGTRQIGSLPEYIYSVTEDSVYINLYAQSSISCTVGGHSLHLAMETRFPLHPQVKIRVALPEPVAAAIHVRVPQWACETMCVYINGRKFAVGKPGSYLPLKRVWKDGDAISFTLPMNVRLSLYAGMDQFPGGLRYGFEYGPILLAAVCPDGKQDPWQLPIPADNILACITPINDKPLHFAVAGAPGHEFRPYWRIEAERFTCFPELKSPAHYSVVPVEAGDLALASRGAIATSDSELATEPGCTSKVIDGIIANPADFTGNRWHSSIATPHPHWVQVKLPRPEKIGQVVINFADPLGHPVSFQGIMRSNGRDHVVFEETNYKGWREYRAHIKPLRTDVFRLLIRASASPRYPNAAQVSQIQLLPPA